MHRRNALQSRWPRLILFTGFLSSRIFLRSGPHSSFLACAHYISSLCKQLISPFCHSGYESCSLDRTLNPFGTVSSTFRAPPGRPPKTKCEVNAHCRLKERKRSTHPASRAGPEFRASDHHHLRTRQTRYGSHKRLPPMDGDRKLVQTLLERLSARVCNRQFGDRNGSARSEGTGR